MTRLDSPPSQIVWAPDSGSIAFRAVVDPGPDPAWAIDMPEGARGRRVDGAAADRHPG